MSHWHWQSEKDGYAKIPAGECGMDEHLSPAVQAHRYTMARTKARRVALIVAVLVCTSLLVIVAMSFPKASLEQDLFSTSSKTLSRQRLASLHSEIDLNGIERQFAINKLGDVRLEAYRERLHRTYETYFAPLVSSSSQHAHMWEAIEAQLTPGAPPSLVKEGIPKHIASSVKDKEKVPAIFSHWQTKNKDWQVSLYDDADMAQYFEERFGVPGMKNRTTNRERARSPFLDQWRAMPHNILQVDTFRYMKILLDGGAYADSDTAAVYPIDRWPGLRRPDRRIVDNTDRDLQMLEGLGSVADVVDKARQRQESSKDGVNASRHNMLPVLQPALVVGIESDAPANGKNYKAEKFARPLQITQFAFLAKPYHPVFLDVLGSIMETSAAFDPSKKPQKPDEFLYLILDWTGPGILSDAIFRYLLARYGADPLQVSGYNKGIRIGDVLVYPELSFRAGTADHFHGDFRFIHHRVMHRWIKE